MTIEPASLWSFLTVLVAVASGVLLVFSKRRRDIDALEVQHRDELEALARTRKEIIEQLRSEIAEMDSNYKAQIAHLTAEIAELRGQYNAMRNFQVQEVIEGVTRGVLAGLGA